MVKLDITITGDLGSGKSTVAKALCKMLNFKYFSTGGIQRQIGRENGMNTLELNYFAEKNLDIDKYIDDFVIKLNDEDESFAIDSRMAWHFIRKSFKIYLTVNPLVAAKRVMADCHRDSEQVMEDVYEKSLNLLERRAAEDKRFKAIYGVDCGDLNNYDLVMDTTHSGADEISNQICKLYAVFSNKEAITKHWVSPKMIYPAQLTENEAGKGYTETDIVKVVELGRDLFILDDHKIISTALLNKVPLIPVIIAAKDEEEIHPGEPVSKFIKSVFNLKLVHEWEEAHGFKFESYPKTDANS